MTKSEFIPTIAPLIVKIGRERGYKIFSAVIAQAVIESNYGQSGLANYNNFFGLKCGSKWKGASVNMKTKEEYIPGSLTTIRDNFRAYPTVEAGVEGYYDFISTKRYANLKTAQSPLEYCRNLKNDGYATSHSYVNTLMNTITKLNLTTYDNEFAQTVHENQEKYGVIDNEMIATEVILGKWGNGIDRVNRLNAAGYDYAAIQKIVNKRLRGW